MKRLICTLIALMMLCSIASAESVDLKSMTEDQLRELRTQIDTELAARQTEQMLDSEFLYEGDLGDYHVAVKSMRMGTEYKTNAPCVAITFLFTNYGSKEANYASNLTKIVYQNGERCEGGTIVNEFDTPTDDFFTDVKDGATVECMSAWTLQDSTSPIEIEFSDFFDFSSDPATIKCVLQLPE